MTSQSAVSNAELLVKFLLVCGAAATFVGAAVARPVNVHTGWTVFGVLARAVLFAGIMLQRPVAASTCPQRSSAESAVDVPEFAVSDLSRAERELIQHAVLGSTLITREPVRAILLEQLLTCPEAFGVERVLGVRLRGAEIVGRLNLGNRVLGAPLDLRDCSLTHPLILTKATGSSISLRGSTVPGVRASFLNLSGTLNLGSGFVASGQVRLQGAKLGQLEAGRGTFNNPYGYALNGNYLTAGAMMSFEEAVIRGTVTLLGATVGGQIDFSRADIETDYGDYAIELDLANATGGVLFRSARLRGGVWMVGLHAVGEIAFQGAQVTASGERAVDASSAKVGLFDMSDAIIVGEVKIAGSTLDTFDATGAQFRNPAQTCLDLDSSIISGAVHANFKFVDGVLDLTNATIDVYRDTREAWPPATRIVGTRYRKIESDVEGVDGEQCSIDERLRWLQLDFNYRSSSYVVLADSYRAIGKERAARQVLMAGERERYRARRSAPARSLTTVWSWFLRSLVGYGYDPRRALVWLVGLVAVGWALTQASYNLGWIVPSVKPAAEFSALRFAADLLFPVAGFRDADGFETTGPGAWLAFGLTFLGWFFGIAAVTSIAAVLRRR